MKIRGSLLTLLIFCGTMHLSIADEQIQSLVHRWLWDRRTFDPASVSEEQMPIIIAELKKHDNRKDTVEQQIARRYLIELGDVETAEKVVSEYLAEDASWQQRSDTGAVLREIAQPWVISMLEPALLRDEQITQYVFTSEDAEPPPRSWEAAQFIQGIVIKSPAFSQEVRDWAKSIPMFPAKVSRDDVRQWWLQNKEHLVKGDYAAVTPLKPVSFIAPRPPPPPKEVSAVAQVELPPPAKSVSQPPAVATVPKTVTKHPPSSMGKILVAALGAVCAVIALWLLAKQRRSKS
jgi:hypothetical protein